MDIPKKGKVFINNYNGYFTTVGSVRTFIGICMQEEALFPYLSIKEHLLLYASVSY